MHPTVSKHYEEELAYLALGGRAVWIRNFVSLCLFFFFQRKQPCAGHPENHLLISVRTFQLQQLWIRLG